MYVCECNECGALWHDDNSGIYAYGDEIGIKSRVGDDPEWVCDVAKHYCPSCAQKFAEE